MDKDGITKKDMEDFDKCVAEIGRFSGKVYPKLKPFIDALFEEGIIKNDIAYHLSFDFKRNGDDVIISHPKCEKNKLDRYLKDNDLPEVWNLKTDGITLR